MTTIPANQVTLEFTGAIRVVSATLESSNKGEKIGCRDNKVAFSWEFLNPFREHHHAIELLVLADGELNCLKICGSGPGWSSRHKRLPTKKERKSETRKLRYSLIMFAACLFGYFRFVEFIFGIPGSELSFRSFLTAIPMFVVCILYYFWIKHVLRRLDRTRLTRR